MAASSTPKMYTEQCANCGHDVQFNAEVIRQDNPYWPWMDSKQLTEITGVVHKLTTQVTNLTDVIRNPGGGLIAQVSGLSSSVVELNDTIRSSEGGLIAQIAALVKCFEQLLAPSPLPSPLVPSEQS